MRLLFAPVLIAGLFMFSEVTLGHGTESHAEETWKVDQSPAESPDLTTSADNQSDETQQPRIDEHAAGLDELDHENNDAQPLAENPAMPAAGPVSRLGEAIEDFTLDDFPTLHPMIVHVPVIMIPLAFLFGLTSIFFTNRYIVALALAFTSAGVLGGFVAAFPMHPHTRGLPEAAAMTLQQHDFFAYSTLAITAFSVMLGVIALLKPNYLTKGLFALTLLLATLCVSVTAHYGGTLTYVHGVGVNGNYLDSH